MIRIRTPKREIVLVGNFAAIVRHGERSIMIDTSDPVLDPVIEFDSVELREAALDWFWGAVKGRGSDRDVDFVKWLDGRG